MSLEMTGKIVKVLESQSGVSKAGKEWVKQSFVIDNGNEYNPEVCFNCFGKEKVEALQQFKVGDEVGIRFNLSSREYNGNYYTSCDAWKIDKVEERYNSVLDEKDNSLESVSDLPF